MKYNLHSKCRWMQVLHWDLRFIQKTRGFKRDVFQKHKDQVLQLNCCSIVMKRSLLWLQKINFCISHKDAPWCYTLHSPKHNSNFSFAYFDKKCNPGFYTHVVLCKKWHKFLILCLLMRNMTLTSNLVAFQFKIWTPRFMPWISAIHFPF